MIAILSLGPVLHIHTYPSRFAPFVPLPGHIFLTVPGVRMPARLLPWALPFIALVAGLGVQEILMRTRRIWVERGLVLLILAGIALEYAPMHSFVGRSVAIPAPLEVSDAYPALRDLEDDVVVVELPNEYSWFGFGTQALYVYGASAHMRRTASYYAGTLPPEPLRLHELAKELPQERARTQLAELGVTHLVLHRHLLGPIEGPELEREMLRACYLSVHRGPQSTILDLRRLEGGCWREEKPWEPNDAAPLE